MSLSHWWRGIGLNSKRNGAKGNRTQLTLELLEDRSVPATLNVTALGVGGWLSDDTRSAAGADLVGATLTHAGKPGQTPTAADDFTIAQQLAIVPGPAGSTFGGAISIDGTTSNSGKTSVSVIDMATGFAAASVLPTTFTATYEWYGQPNPTTRTLGFKIGVQSSEFASSQSGFTAIRSGESAWDLILVHVPATSDNAWSTVAVDATTGTWSLFAQASNSHFTTKYGALPAAMTLADWQADATWGNVLFGASAKVTSIQFGLGSSQRQSISYVDYLQTNLLNGGDVIDFGGGPGYVDDLASDYTITFDADNSGTLTNGDIVTWNPSGTQHPEGTVENLTFGANAFLTIQSAIDAMAPGSVINVAAGAYKDYVTVNKSVTLRGANVGVSGDAARGGESQVIANGNLPGNFGVFTVTSSDVTIDGFTIDGDDPATLGATLATGDDAQVSYGVRPTGAFSNLTVQNNIIKRVFIGFRGDGSASGNLITNNWFDSIGNFDFGYAVSLRTNFYADVTDNLMTRVWSGLHTNNFNTGAGAPATWSYSNNEVHSYAGGLFYWLQYGGSTGLTIDNNDFIAEAGAVANNFGVLMVSIQDAVDPTFTNNTITAHNYGVGLTNVSTSNTVTIEATNSITDSTLAGVYLTDNLTFNPLTLTDLTSNAYIGAANNIAVIVDGATIATASGIGVKVETSRTMAADVDTTATINPGTIIAGDADATGVDVVGALAVTNISGAQISGYGVGVRVLHGTAEVVNSFVVNNTTGIAVLGVGAATINENDLSGNSGLAINNTTGATIDASGNWYGVNTAAGVAATVSPDVDYTPWLHFAADASGVPGFQGTLNTLHVDDDSPQVGGGRITEAIAILPAAGTVIVHAGTYVESVVTAGKAVTLSPGSSPGQATIDGDLTLDGDDTLLFELNGTTPGTQYDQIVVTGSTALGGANFAATRGFNPPAGFVFTIIDGNPATTGQFNGLANNAIVTIGGVKFRINYVNDDVTLTTVSTVTAQSSLRFTDADGDTYFVKLSGPGNVSVAIDDPDGDGKGPIDQIMLDGADPLRSTLSITVQRRGGNGEVEIGSVVGTGLRWLRAPKADLVGAGIALTGSLGQLVIDDVLNGADIVTGAGPTQVTSIAADVIGHGSDITIGAPIRIFNAATMGDGALTAPSIQLMRIRADFAADLHVNGVLGFAAIYGAVSDSTWDAGEIRALAITELVDNWDLHVAGNLLRATLRDVEDASINVAGSVRSFVASTFKASELFAGFTSTGPMTGTFDSVQSIGFFQVRERQVSAFDRSTIAAANIGRVALSSVLVTNTGDLFGVLADLSMGSVRVSQPLFRFNPALPTPQGFGKFQVHIA